MKNPNGYGAIVRLKGKRRKPYAIRISIGYKERICVPNKAAYYPLAIDKYAMTYRKAKNDYIIYCKNDEVKNALDENNIPYRIEFVQERKYIAYFEKLADAHTYLAAMNRGDPIKEHVSRSSEPSFKDVYNKYIEFVTSLNKPPSQASMRSYNTGFNAWSDLHDIRFSAITTKQLQDCLTEHGTLSKASVTRMITILKKMYKYALAHQICDTDLSPYLFSEYTDEKKYIHTPFTDEEIETLWNTHTDGADVVLVMIYTGLRCSEFLELKKENVHLDERYIVGGMKTDAGRDRVVPIHKSILPILKRLCESSGAYVYPNKSGGCYEYPRFRDLKWKVWMKELGMKHYTHDCRHTCATKLEEYGVSDLHKKLILGHAIRDITLGTYTHISKEKLIESMDKWQDGRST